MAPSDSASMGMTQRLSARLQSIQYGCQDVACYEFVPLQGEAFPPVSAGAHVDVHLPNGMIRQYSLLPQSGPQGYRVGVKRDAQGRGGSRWLHDEARVGAYFELSTPRNHFELRADNGANAPVLLLAGGIGITPIYAMMKALEHQGRAYALHYWGRAADQMLFAETLRGNEHVHWHIDPLGNGAPQVSVNAVVAQASPASDVYACGPHAMLDELAAYQNPARRGQVYMERFAASPASKLVAGNDTDAFEVFLQRSGMTVSIPKGQTILEALKERGVDAMYSCEQGVCGACEVRCLEGVPDHRDIVKAPHEHDAAQTIIICCSGSHSERLVLDL